MIPDPTTPGPGAVGLEPPEPDSVLAARAAAGDRGAFEQIYRRHAARVHGLCLRLTGERTRAEALTQDTFVKAWMALGGYGGQAALGAWLGRIAVNRWRDQWRSDQRARRRLVDADVDAADGAGSDRRCGSPPGGGRAAVVPLLTRIDLERMIARLPEGARTVFVLHGIEGFPQAEVAALLGLSEGTVKSQMHRARALLRGMYGEPGGSSHEV